jgi:putative DNA primase/helicase
MLQGDGWQIQFKPDKPWKAEGDKKAPKYRSPLGDYDAMLPSHPEDKRYWHDMEALKKRCWHHDEHPYLVVTEGFFKAIAGCSNGIPTIALLGVEMGLTSREADPQGKRYLVAALEKFARAGFGFITAFDADCATNDSVRRAEVKLHAQLSKFDVPVRSITGLWTVDQGKGMDDFISQQGIDKFREKLVQMCPIELSPEKPQTDKLPPENETASKMAELYRDKLAWESEYKIWRHYGAKYEGMWSEETVESVRGLVHAHLRTLPGTPAFNAGYVSSVVTILQSDLEVKEWNERKDLLSLRDGVLNLATKELHPHSPNHRFTWQLPFKWEDRGVGCEPIEEFLLRITGHTQIAEVLLAFLSAVVTRRSDLQRYLELIGGGGTGKSTFMALAKALAGDDNAVSSRLSLLERNQFETAKFYRKLLVLFPDSERWLGEVSVLKQLTGQDPIRYERKGVQQCRDYVYEGMVILSANEPPESSDRTSGQERRKLTVGLDNRIPEYEGRNLAEEFRPYLPGLLKRVLDMPRDRVTALIKNTERNVPALAEKKWAQLVETNPIAAWVDECVVVHPNAKAYIGKDLTDPQDPRQQQWLYPSFLNYQKASGHKTSMPVKRFSSNLRDLLRNQMKVAITEGRDRNGAYIQGIGLRSYYDPNGIYYPQPITGQCDGCDGFGDGFVTDETLTSDGCDGCDGFFQLSSGENHLLPTEAEGKIGADECGENPSHPSNASLSTIPAVENPSPNPSQPVTPVATSPKDELHGWDKCNAHTAYPNPKSDNVRSSQKRALAIREAYRAARTKEDLAALKRENGGEYSDQEIRWVTKWLKNFFRSEYDYMQATAKVSQPGLL